MITAILKRLWRPLALIGLVAVALVGYGHWRASVTNDEWQLRWAARDLADAQALAHQQAAARTEEQRRQQAINQVSNDAQNQIAAARADAVAANDSVSRLQRTIAELQRKQRSNATGNTSATGSGPTGRTAGDLQAELLRESLETSRQLAAEADRRRIAGLACEQSYDSLTLEK